MSDFEHRVNYIVNIVVRFSQGCPMLTPDLNHDVLSSRRININMALYIYLALVIFFISIFF